MCVRHAERSSTQLEWLEVASWVRSYALQSAGITTRDGIAGNEEESAMAGGVEGQRKVGLRLASMPAAPKFCQLVVPPIISFIFMAYQSPLW